MIEDVIAENTAAMRDLIACWKGMAIALAAPATVSSTPIGLAGSPTVAETVGTIAGDVAGAAVAGTPGAALAPDVSAAVTVTVTDVLNAAAQLIAAKGKPALSAALSEFKVKSIQAIAPDKLQPALAAIQTALDAK